LAKINPELIDRLSDKLGVGLKALYPRIQKIVNETGLERDLAALVLARRNNININKFSTVGQRNEIRGNAPAGEQEPERERRPMEPPRRASKVKKPARKTKGKSVFVVHGRDVALRKSMFDFLRALDLHPLEWDHAIAQAKGNNPYVGDIIDTVIEKAQAVVVMFSPDDLVQLKEQFLSADDRATEGKQQGQARPNVLFEAGLAHGRHPEKTVLVQVGKVKPFSDIGGKHMVRLTDEKESRNGFANRLANIGLAVDRVGNDWMSVGTFAPTEPKRAKRR
jgi:predicted nucleotide-binding protein